MHFVHRSNKEFSARLFACQDSGCTQFYGDGTYGYSPTTYDIGTETTEPERWVLEDVADSTTQFYVRYWDGGSWVDETAIEIAFDNGYPMGSVDTDLQTCLRNVGAIVVAGSPVEEGLFFQEVKYDSGDGLYCFSSNGANSGGFGGIVFAEH